MYRPNAIGIFRSMLILAMLAFSMLARAGEFYEKNGVAINGYDPVSYFSGGEPQKGSEAYSFEYRGSIFRFASAANRDAFAAAPEKYAPQYGGFCAYGAAKGAKAKSEPDSFAVIDGKLYLNFSRSVQAKWGKDSSGFIKEADDKWPEVSKQIKVHE